MKSSPVRTLLILLFVFIGCFGIAYAATGMLTALPAPAIGGTCGPSTASETALEALAEPGSIGAGPPPAASNATGHRQWETFVHECQSLADRRGFASLAILVISLVVAGVGLIWVLRKPRDGDDDDDPTAPAYTPLGLGDPALVGAGAVAGGSGSPATWPGAQPPVYGAPPSPYGTPPPYPGQPYGTDAYPGVPAPPYAAPYPQAPAYPTAPPPAWTQVPTDPAPYPQAPAYPTAPPAPPTAPPTAWPSAPVEPVPLESVTPPTAPPAVESGPTAPPVVDSGPADPTTPAPEPEGPPRA
jgi:hypothetical protein